MDASKGIILDAEPSFDGKTILFSWKPTMKDVLSIWRVNADGTGLVRLTDGRSNCQNVCHLPDGGIAYTCDL